MEVRKNICQIRDRPGYFGLLGLSSICVFLLAFLFITSYLGILIEFVIPAEILAASAVIFAVAAYYRSKES